MTDPIDIEHMPGYNPVVTNGVDSIRKGRLIIKEVSWWVKDDWANMGGYFKKERRPFCVSHGAMLRVSKDGIWRCGELGCSTGCYWP